MALTIQLPAHADQTSYNLARWAEIQNDPELAKLEYRIETDRLGRIIVSPPPAPSHGIYQALIAHHLTVLLPQGFVVTECPVSTSDGVKAIDVAWLSERRAQEARTRQCLLSAPEICVEILSPSNTHAEIAEKRLLYFEAGAAEVWICDMDGRLSFYTSSQGGPLDRPGLCPDFPASL
jgi:Uma2 family endonuclease